MTSSRRPFLLALALGVVAAVRGTTPLLATTLAADTEERMAGHLVPLRVGASARPVLDCGIWGDVDGNDQVNSADALIMLTHAVGLPVPDPVLVASVGDVTADGQVNSVDALAALRFAVGLGTGGTRVNQTVCFPTAGANVTLDLSRTFQTINGWEATIAVGWGYTPALAAQIAEAAVNDLGINRLRVETRSNAIETRNGTTATNDNADPASVNSAGFTFSTNLGSGHDFDDKIRDWALPIRQLVQARGEPFVLNICFVGFDSSTSFLVGAEYAEFVSVVLNHLRSAFAIEPDLWEITLEPDNGQAQRNGTILGNMVKAAGDRARAEGFSKVKFVAPSTKTAGNFLGRWDDLVVVPGALAYLAEASYHLYGATATPADRHAIRDRAATRGVRTAQLERIAATYKDLYADLTEADASAWQQYTLAFPLDDNGAHLYTVNPAAGTFAMGSRTWYLRQYFKYIRPGSVRVGATSTDAAIEPVAFRRRDGRVVLVANTTRGVTLAVAGLPAGTYRVTYTTATQRGASGSTVTIGAGQLLTAAIPAAGVITLSP